ncbi:MAG TPA: sigma-54 dependent transcriptional regulator [Polyangiaceae bacterium]|nr:sigma-54 dependent transcriptional regulator [Polyangiaceae bacterium]
MDTPLQYKDTTLLPPFAPSSGGSRKESAPLSSGEEDAPRSAPNESRRGGAASTSPSPRARAHSAVMREVYDLVARLASTDFTVLLVGETGAGKDVLARTIHEQSLRAAKPFVVFDCGAVAPNLVESELFGHERGAFTGALASREGAFERAHGGTLFIDEIGELPLDLQPRLLRALESRRVRRVGGAEDRLWDVRVIAATNRDLPTEVAARAFREDLYFRLAAAVVRVPPLRERFDDLPLLVGGLLANMGRPHLCLSEPALAKLRSHPWPGNVRELKNALAWATTFVGEDGVLEPRHFKLEVPPPKRNSEPPERLPLAGQRLDAIERDAILQTLILVDGNKVHAARALGISASTLYEKLKKYDL